eukprot:CAMPEP_0184481714 /NCGR_PEP_ID=MMETSP0113_2-20130426/3287_1 /TAXON_ID=91329 /ORGANISM="Norrisiella sphaerica, Strain BC52" /LENGTH=33 /DNA_ID= /DNA_START= /DNA_END= /DNA_ORIENTATION=
MGEWPVFGKELPKKNAEVEEEKAEAKENQQEMA